MKTIIRLCLSCLLLFVALAAAAQDTPIVDYFRATPTVTTIGDRVTLSWSVTEGDSVTITHPIYDESDLGDTLLEVLPMFQEFENLPLTGSLEVTIPDLPAERRSISGAFLLFVIKDGNFPAAYNAKTSVVYDYDGNLDCQITLFVGEKGGRARDAIAGGETSVSWDSCGQEHTLLRLALATDGYQLQPVGEEFIEIPPSGTMTIPLPDEPGQFYIQLYYEHEGERYILGVNELELAAG